MESCCYAKCFTDITSGLTTWAMIESQQGKTMSIDEMREFINPTSIHLREYIDFIILFDYLTESIFDDEEQMSKVNDKIII